MKWLRAKLKGWKTRIMSAMLFVVGLFEVIDPEALINVLGEHTRGYVTLAFAITFYILRQVTTTPAGKGDDHVEYPNQPYS